MSEICFVNTYPAHKRYSYDERIALLRKRKVSQTEEKARLGGADEDDYGKRAEEDPICGDKRNHTVNELCGSVL